MLSLAPRGRVGRAVKLWAVLLVAVMPALGALPTRAASSTPPANTPRNNTAFIFDALADRSDYLQADQTIANLLRQEQYKVYLLEDVLGGSGSYPGLATLANFTNMAGAGVVVITTHAGVPGIVVEMYPATGNGLTSSLRAYAYYLTHGYSPRWIGFRYFRDINRYVIYLTPAGVAHFFAGSHVSLLVNNTCDGTAYQAVFNAQSYFAYQGEACNTFSAVAGDETQLFNRLAGMDGPDDRTTTGAYAAGGFSPNFQLLYTGAPVALSPAVHSVTPADGSSVSSGQLLSDGNHLVSVTFDTVMDTSGSPDAVVTADGGTLSHFQWQDNDSTLTFELACGTQPTVTLTVHNDQAIAGAGRFPNQLDGNQNPSNTSGQAPNGDDYVWKLTCGSSHSVTATIQVTGPYNGDCKDTPITIATLQSGDHVVGDVTTSTGGLNLFTDGPAANFNLPVPIPAGTTHFDFTALAGETFYGCVFHLSDNGVVTASINGG